MTMKNYIHSIGQSSANALSIYGKGYIGLGRDSLRNQLNDCCGYNPANDNWSVFEHNTFFLPH